MGHATAEAWDHISNSTSLAAPGAWPGHEANMQGGCMLLFTPRINAAITASCCQLRCRHARRTHAAGQYSGPLPCVRNFHMAWVSPTCMAGKHHPCKACTGLAAIKPERRNLAQHAAANLLAARHTAHPADFGCLGPPTATCPPAGLRPGVSWPRLHFVAAWQGLDGLVCGCMCLQHIQHDLARAPEVEHLACSTRSKLLPP